ncbi:MAG: SusC/RagA family TonB-linked outer membrane protein [Cyclobacteriaceae bacterium]|nr:SusC/RagA family TonB-linked outer membrane protein [Cyclobacteriaceae bacterium]
MLKFYLRNFFLGMLLIASGEIMAQGFTASGSVKDARTGDAMPGVNVTVKGTTLGTVTNADGSFSLQVESGTATLVFSFIGYRTLETGVSASNSSVTINLEEDYTSLEEVVITGLASSIKRSNLANAVTTVSSKDLTGATQIQTADGALYGKVAGANIRMNSGAPGGGLAIQLRGLSSLTQASAPLIILDGVYINNSFQRTGRATVTGAGASSQDDGANRLADLNPNDIENIEVLKGPSAAAIYGTRANAGVIVITTKKGQAGKTVVSLGQDIGFGQPLRLLGVDAWSEDKINTFYNNPSATVQARRLVELQRYNDAVASGTFMNYEDFFYNNTALLSNTRLSVRGGDDKTKFFVSGSLTNEDGIVRRTGFERNSIRANIDHKLTKDISLSFNSNFIRTDTDRGFTGNQNNSGASIGYNISYVPTYFDLRPVEGVYPNNPYFAENPIALTDKGINNSVVNRFIQSFSLDANLLNTSNSQLKLRVNGGLDYLQNSTLVYLPDDLQFQRGQANPGDVLVGRQESLNTNFQAALVYNWNLSRINMNTQAGFARLDFKNESLFNRGRGLAPGQKNLKQAAAQEIESQFSSTQQDVGIFIQQEMNFEDKIIGTVGVRWDKSNTNGDPNKFFAFPKASLAVNVANFDFWTVEAVSALKPRIAYGQTAGPVPFGTTFTALEGTNIGGFGSVVSTTLENLLIVPERAEEIEFGIDAAFLNNRISLEATYYIKNTKDNLQPLNLAPSTGVISTLSNEAELQNKGIELGISGSILDKSNIRWFSRLLWWKNDVVVTKLGIPSYTTGAFGTALGTFLVREGVSPTTIVGTPSTAPGEFTVWGNAQPDWTTSWYNSLTFLKNFEMNFLMEYRRGGDNINLTSFLTDGGGTTKGWFDDDDGDGIPNGRQRPPAPYNNAGRWVQDATFLKVREIGLYYNVPKDVTTKWFGNVIQRARVGFSGNNLFMITDYEGYDPETSTFGAQALANNVDVAPYPSTRRLFFHIQIDF